MFNNKSGFTVTEKRTGPLHFRVGERNQPIFAISKSKVNKIITYKAVF